MNFNLVIHNIGFTISAIATLGALIFVTLNNPQAKGHTPMAFLFLSVLIFIVSHIVGVNIADPSISQNIFMFNLSVFFIGIFSVHTILSILGKDRKRVLILVAFYVVGISACVYFGLNSELFLLESVPKMYFPNYYEPGPLNWVRIAFVLGFCLLYIFYEIVDSYRTTEDKNTRKQLKFLSFAFLATYIVGHIPNFLVFGINIDPLWGMAFMVVFAILFFYAALKYELMNIKVIAKQAFLYAITVGTIGGTIILFEYLNRIITLNHPDFPVWVLPSLSIFLVMVITLVIWEKIREVDLLRYEFITTVTHKFRTPLTQIRWATDSLSKSNLTLDDKDQIGYIKSANSKLIELTNLLVNISEAEGSVYNYKFEKNNLKPLIEEALEFVETSVSAKKIQIKNNFTADVFAKCDASRVKFIIQTFIENAVSYTPANGTIEISLYEKSNKAFLTVKDSGIGIAKNELPLIFSKFYRGSTARTTDTEGMGIGLFISKEIIGRHDGKIWVDSDGSGKGAAFSFSLPVAE
jgi:signal transduction histidine kinase